MFVRKKVNKVFTPRSADVNKKMYIDRPELEKALLRGVEGSMHSFLFGGSGNGKSWMYKRLFDKNNIRYRVVNCGSVNMCGSIMNEIYEVCVDNGHATKTGYKEKKEAAANMLALKAKVVHDAEFHLKREGKLEEAYSSLSQGKSLAVIVIDNLEMIFKNKNLMDELASILILLDDTKYAKYNIKFLLVGTPNNVVEYFNQTTNSSSISNRIKELPRITSLSERQVETLLNQGFNQLLEINISIIDLKSLSKHVYNITLGVPQRVHEYCEELAYLCEDNDWLYNEDMINRADIRWMSSGLRQDYQIIEKSLNSVETIHGRRNQVLYVISKITRHQFDMKQVSLLIKKEFTKTAPSGNNGIGQILASLANEERILKKGTAKNTYGIIDARLLSVLRIMLRKNEQTEEVIKVAFEVA